MSPRIIKDPDGADRYYDCIEGREGNIYAVELRPRGTKDSRASPYSKTGGREGKEKVAEKTDEVPKGDLQTRVEEEIGKGKPPDRRMKPRGDEVFVEIPAHRHTVTPAPIIETPPEEKTMHPSAATWPNSIPVGNRTRTREEVADEQKAAEGRELSEAIRASATVGNPAQESEPVVSDIEMTDVRPRREATGSEKKDRTITEARIKRKPKVTFEDAIRRHPNDDDPEKDPALSHLPRAIRVTATTDPFDIEDFFRTVKMTGLSLADLLHLSPYLRKRVMYSLKTIPKEKRINLLRDHLDDIGMGDNDQLEIYGCYLFTRVLEMSNHGTFRIPGRLGRLKVEGMADGGSCVNVVSKDFALRTMLTIKPKTTTLSFRQVNGDTCNIVGEIHDAVFELAGLMIPITALVVEKMGGDLLLGRPFLEKVKTKADFSDGSHYMQWGGWIIIASGKKNDEPQVLKHVQSVSYYMDNWRTSKQALIEEDRKLRKKIGLPLPGKDDLGESDGHASEDTADEISSLGVEDSSEEAEGSENLIALLCSVEELKEMDKNGEIESISVGFPAEVCRDGEDELDALMRIMGLIGEEDDNEIGEMSRPEVKICHEEFGVLIRYDSTLIEPTPLMALDHPDLMDRAISVGDIPEVHAHLNQITELFVEFRERFPRPDDEHQPFANVEPIQYRLKPGVTQLPMGKMRRWSQKESDALLAFKKKNANYLEPSISRSTCLPLVVMKKDGVSPRIVINYIPVNRLIMPFHYPLPPIDYVIRKLLNFKMFSYWDFLNGYHGSSIHPESRYLTAVIWPDGTVSQWKVAPQGFIDSGQWFTKHVATITDDPILKKYVGHYVDDGHAGTEDYDDHLVVLRKFFEKMDYHRGSISGKKSGFFVRVFKLLGIIIAGGKLYADPEKIKKCQGFRRPATPAEMKGFIHFVGFYSNRVPEFPRLSKILLTSVKLGNKDPELFKEIMSDEQSEYHKAFYGMKRAMINAKVLIRFDKERTVILATDASEWAISYVLAHPESEGDSIDTTVTYEPVVFGGRTLSDTETRYTSAEKEVLAVVDAVKRLHVYTADQMVHVFTDHSAMLHYANKGSQSKRITRFILALSDYKLTFHHRLRGDGKDADGLTRLDWRKEPARDTDDEIMSNLPSVSDVEDSSGLYRVNLMDLEDPYFTLVKRMLGGDELTECEDLVRRRIRKACLMYFIEGEQLYRRSWDRPKLYIEPMERLDKLKEYHGGDVFGHMGVNATFSLMRLKYYWPTMYADVKRMVEGCEACTVFTKKKRLQRELFRIPPPATFNVIIGVDFVGPLPGGGYLLSFICYLTKWAETWCVASTSALTCIKYTEKWRHRYGSPEVIITDNGSGLKSDAYTAHCTKKGTELIHASTNHPETNGLIENYQGNLCRWIAKDLDDNEEAGSHYKKYVRKGVWMWRTHKKEATSVSPYVMVFGQEPRDVSDTSAIGVSKMGLTELVAIRDEEGNDFQKAIREFAQDKILKRHEAFEKENSLRRQLPKFEPGDRVFYWNKPLEQQHSKKFERKWKGPFNVRSVHLNGTCLLEDDNGKIIGKSGMFSPDHLILARRELTLEELLEKISQKEEEKLSKEESHSGADVVAVN